MRTKFFLLLTFCCAAALTVVPMPGLGPNGMPGLGPGGLPTDIPGGVSECKPVTFFHVYVANVGLSQIGMGHTLRWVTGVRTQVVAGTNYHLELHVSRGLICENCKVVVWRQLNGDLTKTSHTCSEVCCF